MARLLGDITSIPLDNKVSTTLETYGAYLDLLARLEGVNNVLPLTNSEVEAIANSKAEKLQILRRSIFIVRITCVYPSNSAKRVKETYTKLQQLLP